MHKELRSQDIRNVARGYWRDNFRWSTHPRLKTDWLIALITFVVGVAIIFATVVDKAQGGGTVASSAPAVTMVAVILVLVGGGFFVKGMLTMDAEGNRFVNEVADRWESYKAEPPAHPGHGIPDAQDVENFCKGRAKEWTGNE